MDDFNLTYDDYLAHYGVKGMKWGVRRRSDNSSGSKKSDRTPEEQAARKDRNRKIAKGAAAAALVAGGVAVAYASRNNPSVRRGVSAAASLGNKMATKVVDAKDDASLRRMAKRGAKANENNPFLGKSIYEVALMADNMSAKKKPDDPAVDRMIKKVSEGRSYKDALADEAFRYGVKLTGQYAKEKVRRKFSRQS